MYHSCKFPLVRTRSLKNGQKAIDAAADKLRS